MLPAVSVTIQPEYILYPHPTVLPPGIAWPDVGGDTPALGPLISVRDQFLMERRILLSRMVWLFVTDSCLTSEVFPYVDVAYHYVLLLYTSTACLHAA